MSPSNRAFLEDQDLALRMTESNKVLDQEKADETHGGDFEFKTSINFKFTGAVSNSDKSASAASRKMSFSSGKRSQIEDAEEELETT